MHQLWRVLLCEVSSDEKMTARGKRTYLKFNIVSFGFEFWVMYVVFEANLCNI